MSPMLGGVRAVGVDFESLLGDAADHARRPSDHTDYRSWILGGAAVVGGIILSRLAPRLLPEMPGLRGLFGVPFHSPASASRLERALSGINRLLHEGGRISLPTLCLEMGLRHYFGYERHLSPIGGIAGMLFFQRLSIQYGGLDVVGTNALFIIDLAIDALMQVQSGEKWRDVDFSKLALRYGTVTLLGQMRARWVRNLVFYLGGRFRIGSSLMKSAAIRSGVLQSGRLVWRQDLGRDKLLLKLFSKSSINNGLVFLSEEGAIVNPNSGRILQRLTKGGRRSLAGLLGREKFSQLFADGGEVFDPNGSRRLLKIKLGGGVGLLGMGLFLLIQEPMTGPIIDAFLGAWFRGEDFAEVYKWTFWKGIVLMPLRQAWKLKTGIDTFSAVGGDRLIKYVTEPVLTKIFPIYAEKGLWRKNYREVSRCRSLDEFLDFHIGPKIWQGGLARYNWRILSGKSGSPYAPMVVSYRLLAEFYATDGALSAEARETVEKYLDQLIEEASRRRRGERAERSRYDDATIDEHALALSAAVVYANRQNGRFFAELVRRRAEWFSPFVGKCSHLDAVEKFIEEIQQHSN